MPSGTIITESGQETILLLESWFDFMKRVRQSINMIQKEVMQGIVNPEQILGIPPTADQTEKSKLWAEAYCNDPSEAIYIRWISLSGNILAGRRAVKRVRSEFSKMVSKFRLSVQESKSEERDFLLEHADAIKLLLSIKCDKYIQIFNRAADFLIENVPEDRKNAPDVSRYLPELKKLRAEKS